MGESYVQLSHILGEGSGTIHCIDQGLINIDRKCEPRYVENDHASLLRHADFIGPKMGSIAAKRVGKKRAWFYHEKLFDGRRNSKHGQHRSIQPFFSQSCTSTRVLSSVVVAFMTMQIAFFLLIVQRHHNNHGMINNDADVQSVSLMSSFRVPLLTPPSLPPPPRAITLIFGTKGELANHLHSIAHALRVKEWVESKYPHLTVLLQAEHRDDNKWHTVLPLLTQCFPVLRENIEFWQGGVWMSEPIDITSTHSGRQHQWELRSSRSNASAQHQMQEARAKVSSRYTEMERIQQQWLTNNGFSASNLHMDHCLGNDQDYKNRSCWTRKLNFVLRMHREQEQWNQGLPRTPHLPSEPKYPTTESRLKYVSLPFLRTDTWSFYEQFSDEYYNMIRRWFAMNQTDPLCCPTHDQLPDRDEIVFHYRNFYRERFDNVADEVNATQLQFLLESRSLQSSSSISKQKIALLSRYSADLYPYVKHLGQLSPIPYETRIIENGTGTSDFCFLQQSQFYLIGVRRSSFVRWAAMLGHSKVLIYLVNHSSVVGAVVPENGKVNHQPYIEKIPCTGWHRHIERFSCVVMHF
jgi:hypothetical protein